MKSVEIAKPEGRARGKEQQGGITGFPLKDIAPLLYKDFIEI